MQHHSTHTSIPLQRHSRDIPPLTAGERRRVAIASLLVIRAEHLARVAQIDGELRNLSRQS